jgi:hypothetical protein
MCSWCVIRACKVFVVCDQGMLGVLYVTANLHGTVSIKDAAVLVVLPHCLLRCLVTN